MGGCQKDPDVKSCDPRQDNEKDMIDAFYTYLLGVDTTNNDIPIIFNSIYHDDHQYAKELLESR
jgi:hypothetical protein